jgi:predicted enzyme related to lactoylglutathione lyase
MAVNFNSILIGSDNPDRLVEYYKRILGEPTFSDSGYTGWQLGGGMVSIGAHSEVHGSNEQPGRLIWNIESADVQGEFDRMVAAGAIIVREPYGFEGIEGAENARIATLADPDGNYFQLMTPMGPPSEA